MTREKQINDAIKYLEGIWGEYGRHERYTKIVVDYIDQLEIKLQIHRELLKFIEQKYEEANKEIRDRYADGEYHGLSMSDGASYVLRQISDKWHELTR